MKNLQSSITYLSVNEIANVVGGYSCVNNESKIIEYMLNIDELMSGNYYGKSEVCKIPLLW